MVNKKICIELEGDETLLDGGIEAFCYQNNYQDKITDIEGNEIDNPQTKLDFAKDKLSDFMRQTIKAYNIEQAKILAAETAKVQSEQNLDQLVMTVNEV